MNKPHIYLSPHPDDVALSCGGCIYDQSRQGEPVLVVTFFGASPPPMAFSSFAQGQHDKWEVETDAMAHRRAEDMAALKVLGAEPLYLDYLDCIYRLHPQTGETMYASEEGIFGEIDPAEAGFHLALAQHIVEIAGSPRLGLTLYVPLTAGHHVDHQLLQRAGIALLGQGYRVMFYEDHPYAAKPGMIRAALAAWRGPKPLQPHILPISEAAMAARIAAIACYASQIRTLFTDLATMESLIRGYCASLAQGGGYAERYWLPRATNA